jgi:hypothetical protein
VAVLQIAGGERIGEIVAGMVVYLVRNLTAGVRRAAEMQRQVGQTIADAGTFVQRYR